MWSDDLDNEMRRAAQDEGAGMTSRGWEKMEAMLDEHLPVEKKKRRFLFLWWFAALLLVGGSTYLLLRNHKPATEKELATSSVGKTGTAEQLTTGNRQSAIDNRQSTPAADTFLLSSITKDDQRTSSTKTKENVASVFYNKNPEPILLTYGPIIRREKQENQEPASADFSVSQNAGTVGTAKPAQNNTTFDDHLSSYNNELVADFSVIRKHLIPVSKILTIRGMLKTAIPHFTRQEVFVNPDLTPYDGRYFKRNKNNFPVVAKTKKRTASSKNKFSLLLSAGPDLSSIGRDKQGRWKMLTGVGLQYQFSKRFSLRTGFYASRKIYEVKPKDYNPPPYFWQYYPGMQKIDADCKVYEVPVTLVFDVTKNQKNNFYVTAGSSTYIMNKEVYGYTYKDNLGYDRYAQRTAPEKSVAYLSTIGLSAGYSRQLSSRVAVSVEPYLKIPVSGIGYGKVKLTSGGALINGIIRLGKN